MLKIIILVASLFLAGFLVVNDNWFITVSGFGYEITISSFLLLLLVLTCLYLIHLIKCPFHWMCKLKGRHCQHQQNKRETYLSAVMQAVLENDKTVQKQLLKQRKSYWDKKETRALLVEALLDPNKTVFEILSKQPETELAGLHGLYELHKAKGNLKDGELILNRAVVSYPDIAWVHQGLFDLSLLQHDWENALTHWENLRKLQLISKEVYQSGLSALYLKTGKVKEAYALNKSNPLIARSYAADTPEKAADILITSWRTVPCWETYVMYMDLYKDETAAKQMKALKKLIGKNPNGKLALLATADTSIRLELWSHAKETMEVYFQLYPHTRQAVQLMADIIRKGWHHEEEAREWENKPIETADLTGWICAACNRSVCEWEAVCPHCNAFDKIMHR